MRIVLHGPPATGKRMLGERFVVDFRIIYLAVGQILREEAASGSALGKLANASMQRGELIADDVIIKVVLERLSEPDCQERGWVLDGFPRTKAQADAMVAHGIGIDAFILLEVPPEELMDRVLGRLFDPKTGRTYHAKTNPPPKSVMHRIISRPDDTDASAVKRRIAAHDEQLPGILAVFDHLAGNMSVVAKIDGARKPKAVYRDVRQAAASRVWLSWKGLQAPDGTNYRMYTVPRTDAPIARSAYGGWGQASPAPIAPSRTPTVVLIHGIGNFSAVWDKMARAITAQAGLSVLTYDLVGRGHTPMRADSEFGASAHVTQLRTLLTSLSLGDAPVVLIGHSMGGAIAALYAEAHGGPAGSRTADGQGAAPHVVAVALLAPAGLMNPSQVVTVRRFASCAPALLKKVLRKTQLDAQERDFVEPGSDAAVAALRRLVLQAEANPNAFDAFFQSVLDFPLFGLYSTALSLGRTTGLPVLLLWGARDKVVKFTPCHGRWWGALRAARHDGKEGCTLTDVVLPELGHGAFLEQRELVHRPLIAWLKGHVVDSVRA